MVRLKPDIRNRFKFSLTWIQNISDLKVIHSADGHERVPGREVEIKCSQVYCKLQTKRKDINILFSKRDF